VGKGFRHEYRYGYTVKSNGYNCIWEGARRCADTLGRINVRKSMVMKMQFRYRVVNDVGVNKQSWQWRSTERPFMSCLWAQFC
jgi:hypothetical protein